MYEALKDKLEAFKIPDYAKRGYDLWLKKGGKVHLKPLKGRLPQDAYERMVNERGKKPKN